MLKTRKKWALAALVLLAVGIALLILPPYASYCEGSSNHYQYRCAFYEITAALVSLASAYNGVITAVATAAIAYFTWTIKRINNSQLAHSHQVERAYISGGGGPEVRDAQSIPITTIDIEARIITPPTSTKILTGNFLLCINNYGKTPGELWRVGIEFCEADAVPRLPIYKRMLDFHDWIGPGTANRPIMAVAIPKLKRPAVYGRFFYRDIFGGAHSSGFINELKDRDSVPLLAPAAYTEERDEP